MREALFHAAFYREKSVKELQANVNSIFFTPCLRYHDKNFSFVIIAKSARNASRSAFHSEEYAKRSPFNFTKRVVREALFHCTFYSEDNVKRYFIQLLIAKSKRNATSFYVL